jgi:PRTRC genetic system protein E
MTTNFFQNIIALNVPGHWNISITTDEQGKVKIIGMYNIPKNGTQASKVVPPFVMGGTAEEIDNQFFDTIEKPVQETAGFFNNMEDYRKGLEKAKAVASAKTATTAKLATATVAKTPDQEMPDPKAEKKKTYDTALKTINDLQADCKYEEAIALIPPIEEYPDKEKELKILRSDLNRKKEQMAQFRLL